MKRTLLMLVAALVTGAAGVTAATAAPGAANVAASQSPKDQCASKKSKWEHMQCEEFEHSAPGDEYFGRMKLSYLGINNTFHDEAIRAGDYTTDSGIISKVGFADEALNQWAQRYPGDPQLARSYFLAIQMYKKIYTREAQQKAWQYMKLIVARFPTSYFGKLEKADIAHGFTEHWFALAQTCPTPLPKGAVAAPTADPTPTPIPKAGEPKVDVIVPPCVNPPAQ